MTEFEQLNNRFPFLTLGRYIGNDVVGIMQNMDQSIISMYVYSKIPTPQLKKQFLELGETWWWESNRKIPINMFLGDDMKLFSPYMETYILKEFEYILGPQVSLDNLMSKRVKRRSIQLIRKIN